MGEMRHANKIMDGKLEEKRPLGRLRHRWENVGEIGLEGVNWILMVQDRDR
jgi:hypothetical protein